MNTLLAFGRKVSHKKRCGLVVVLVLAFLLPFVNKAFHIDDTLVIYPARQILKSPMRPFDFEVNWYGEPQSMWELTNPPFVFYYLAPIVSLFGEKESMLHISYLIFAVVAGISMYWLGKYFTKSPLACALLLVATPAFLVSATGIMPDIPFLAFYLSAAAVYIQAQDKRSMSLTILSGVLVGLACLTKYTGLTLFPLLLSYSFVKEKRGSGTAIALGLGLTLFGLWCLYSKMSYGHLQPIEVCKYFDFRKEALLNKALGTLSYIGGGTIFPLLFFLLCKKGKDVLVYFLAVSLIICLSLKTLLRFEYTVPQIILFVFFSSLGLFFCIRGIFQKLWRHRDRKFLLLWFFGIFFFNIIIELAAVRYVLILVPPMILLLMREIEWTPNLRRAVGTGIVLTLLVGMSVSCGDYRYANCYRDFALRKAANLTDEGKVWFRGHWGFQYYMEKEGFEYLANNQMPASGDFIVIPFMASYIPLPQEIDERLELVDIITYRTSFPIRTIHWEQHAGFYSHFYGFLPFMFSRAYLERFYIWKFIDESKTKAEIESLESE